MIARDHVLPVSRQAKLLKLARSTVYYRPRPVSREDLALMRRLDEMHLDSPFAGARMPRGVSICGPNQVWAMDISYIPMRRGFVYLAAVVDVASRRVLAHRVSITMEAAFCVEAVEEALARHGKPEIFNTDQGSLPGLDPGITSLDFTGVLTAAGVAISMDGKGAWRDNVFVERLWRTIKYEEVYLKAYDSVSEARASISKYVAFYNSGRPHSSLDGHTPDKAYFGSATVAQAA